MTKQLKILKIESDKSLKIKTITHSTKSMQSEVEGPFSYLEVSDGIDVWFNDEFLFLDLSPTIYINGHLLHGPVFFAGHDDEGETRSLTDYEMVLITQGMIQVEMNAKDCGVSND